MAYNKAITDKIKKDELRKHNRYFAGRPPEDAGRHLLRVMRRTRSSMRIKRTIGGTWVERCA